MHEALSSNTGPTKKEKRKPDSSSILLEFYSYFPAYSYKSISYTQKCFYLKLSKLFKRKPKCRRNKQMFPQKCFGKEEIIFYLTCLEQSSEIYGIQSFRYQPQCKKLIYESCCNTELKKKNLP
jgi:hypothetical protein